MRIPGLQFVKNTFNAVSLAIIGAGIVLLIAGTTYYIQQERQRASIDQQTSRTNQLIKDLQASVEDNHKLQQEDRNYAYCNAVLLAYYTQNLQPIQIDDLNKCVFSSFPKNTGSAPSTQSSSTTRPQVTNNTIQNLQPSNSTTPPNNLGGGEQVTPSPIVSVPGVIDLNVPCINLLQLVQTCK